MATERPINNEAERRRRERERTDESQLNITGESEGLADVQRAGLKMTFQMQQKGGETIQEATESGRPPPLILLCIITY